MRDYLCSEKIWVRFIGLYGIGVILFIIAWTISFYYLPEGIMKGSSVASKLAGEGLLPSVAKEFGRIFVINLFMASFIVAANYVLRINRIPLGYIIPPLWFISYGLIIGSNSFTFALPQRVGPSLIAFQRSGIYELAAYTIIAVTTYNFSRYEIKAIFKTNSEKITERPKILPQQYFGLIVALLILLGSNLKEVFMIFNR